MEDREGGSVLVRQKVLQRSYVLSHLDEHTPVALGQREQPFGSSLMTLFESGLVVFGIRLGVSSGKRELIVKEYACGLNSVSVSLETWQAYWKTHGETGLGKSRHSYILQRVVVHVQGIPTGSYG